MQSTSLYCFFSLSRDSHDDDQDEDVFEAQENEVQQEMPLLQRKGLKEGHFKHPTPPIPKFRGLIEECCPTVQQWIAPRGMHTFYEIFEQNNSQSFKIEHIFLTVGC